MSERCYLAISIKHTKHKWKFGMPCILLGNRTTDNEERCYGGYTMYPSKAELYSLDEWRKKYGSCEWMKTDEPVLMDVMLCHRWRKYDTVLVRYDDYVIYCNAADLPISLEDDYLLRDG